SQLQISEQAKLFKSDGKVLIATMVDSESDNNAEVLTMPAKDDQVDLSALMTELAQREINELMVEAGAVLNGALLREQLIDELVIYMAPKLMGDDAKGIFHLPELKTMAQNIDLNISDIRAVGNDWRITAVPEYNKRT
ncbi:MAG: riboflavin biosynthesis protein RibD, partial [Gammaproteobacteria bacterium]